MSLHDRVAASFISRYFELLMTDAKALSSLYLPKAQFNHEGKTTSITGSENIAKALARIYPQANHGRVMIKEMKVQSTEASQGRFVVVVGGSYYRRTSNDVAEEFRHVIELQEHTGSNGVYGIFADTRQDLSKSAPTAWALETPPMFAKAGNENAIPELVQPPASAPITTETATPPVAHAKAPTPKISPRKEAVHPTPAAPAPEAKPVEEKKKEAAAPSPAATAAAAAPAEKKTFADLFRGLKPVAPPAAPVQQPEVKTEEVKPTEPKKGKTETTHKEESAKKKEEPKEKDSKKKEEPKEKVEGKASRPKKDTAAAGAEKNEKSDAKEGAEKGERKPRKEGGKSISHNVIFYDVIVKGLAQESNDQTVITMIGAMAPIKKVNVKSQPDKKDSSITRTFAFVLFDHDAITGSGSTVSATIQRVIKESRAKFAAQRIQVDEVREKFVHEEPAKQERAPQVEA